MNYVSASEKQEIDPQDTDHQKLDETLASTTNKLTELNKDRTQTQDATIEKSGDSFKIKPEITGDTIDVTAAINALKTSVKDGKNKIDLTKFQTKPKVTATDKNLTKQVDEMNAIANTKGTYSINGNTFQIPRSEIANWLTYTDGKVDLDTTQVKNYVTGLGEKYNTSTNDTKFKSTKRGEVTVPVGTYSWSIKTDAETEALKSAILAGKDFTRSPIVQGATTADHPLIEDTYIEVDLKTNICGITKMVKLR